LRADDKSPGEDSQTVWARYIPIVLMREINRARTLIEGDLSWARQTVHDFNTCAEESIAKST
jgi:hypothetical protein